MPTHSRLDEIKKLVAQGQVEEAADTLLVHTEKQEKKYNRQAILLKSRLERVQQDEIEGTISHSDKDLEWSRISMSILELVENIRKGEAPLTPEEVEKLTASSSNRKLVAVLFTDIVGYAAMMQQNERQAVATVKRHKRVLERFAAQYEGEVLHYYGDGSLSIFQSALQALRCAKAMQREFQSAPKVPLRIGIHVGEILIEGQEMFGNSINIASRIETLGTAGAVLFSKEVAQKVKNQPEFKITSLGRFHFKNIEDPMEVFALSNEGFPIPDRQEMEGKLKAPKRRSPLRRAIGWAVAAVIAAGLTWGGMELFAEDPPPLKEEVTMVTLNGMVSWHPGGQPVEGAKLFFNSGDIQATTGKDGTFSIDVKEKLNGEHGIPLVITYKGEEKSTESVWLHESRLMKLKIRR